MTRMKTKRPRGGGCGHPKEIGLGPVLSRSRLRDLKAGPGSMPKWVLSSQMLREQKWQQGLGCSVRSRGRALLGPGLAPGSQRGGNLGSPEKPTDRDRWMGRRMVEKVA